MTDQFPPEREREVQKKLLDESSALLDELAKLRHEIEQDSISHLGGFSQYQNHQDITESGYVFHKTPEKTKNHQNSNDFGQTFPEKSSRPIYRFDFEHVDHEAENKRKCEFYNSNNEDFSQKNTARNDRDSFYEPLLSKNDTNSHENQTRQTPQTSSPKQQDRAKNQESCRFDDAPVVIPIRRKKANPTREVRSEGNQAYRSTHHFQPDEEDSDSLPWRFFSRYENETLLKLVVHASNLSLFLGWGAMACGVLVFIRSFFVSSMIWLSYGLPILSLGAVCLFLGIVLGILSEKMQQINDLKQSLTTQRILSKTKRKFDPPHDTGMTKERMPYHERENVSKEMPPHVPVKRDGSDEPSELDDVYDRLLQLRSEIDELIGECENS